MSLGKLSTELDNRVANFLIGHPPALNALSKVSKYYHGIAEPRLYTHVVLKAGDFLGLMQLCYTIISRVNLALYIQGFSLISSSSVSQPTTQVTKGVFDLPCAGVVEGAVSSYFNKGKAIHAPERYQNISPVCGGFHPDRMLAFILCAAKNIEDIKLDCAIWGLGNTAIEEALTQQWAARGFLSI